MPKKDVAERRRAEIVGAVLGCVAAGGLESLTIEQVARRAGCSKGIVLYYFASKKQLLLEAFRAFLEYYDYQSRPRPVPASAVAVLDDLLVEALPLPGDADQPPLPPEDKARLFVHFFSRAIVDADFAAVVRRVYHAQWQGLSRLFEWGGGRREFRPGVAGAAAFGFLALMVGASVLRVVDFAPVGIGTDRDICREMLGRMIHEPG